MNMHATNEYMHVHSLFTSSTQMSIGMKEAVPGEYSREETPDDPCSTKAWPNPLQPEDPPHTSEMDD